MTPSDGLILPGQAPPEWGFTPDRFSGDSYLWRSGGRVFVSLIVAKSPGKGHFKALVLAIEASGFVVAVPTPVGAMRRILGKWGFAPHVEDDPDMGAVEVWSRAVSAPS